MQAFIETIPWIVFGLVYWLGGGLYPATGTLMVAMALLLVYDWVTTRKIPRSHLLLAVGVWVFGTATLLMHDVRFLQWKASLIYWVFGVAFAGTAFIGKQSLLERLVGGALPEGVTVTASSWRNSSVLMGSLYIVLGAVNLWVAMNRSEADWVRFKVVIAPIVALVVTLGIIFWVLRGAPSGEDAS
ncbi:MAG TPA: septation protein IspZ [Steroidobacteraceae bacterium]|nr:septation protein IspZ [Steroidobacteraceae bacterium]